MIGRYALECKLRASKHNLEKLEREFKYAVGTAKNKLRIEIGRMRYRIKRITSRLKELI